MAGEYQTYKDANGVEWTIITASKTLSATVKDDAQPRYDPPASDVGPTPLLAVASGDAAEKAEGARRSFQNLRETIDKYAKDNETHVILRVSGAGGGGVPWWVWLGLLGLAMSDD